MVDFLQLSPISRMHLWSSDTVIFGFFFTSLTKALLPRQLSLAGQPALGRVLVVPNVFHLRIMEDTVLLGTLSAAEFFVVTLARSVPCHNSVSELFRQFLWPHDSHLLWHALWAVRSYIDRCVAFLIKSNQYNQTQLDSNEGVEPSQGWSEEMDSTWVKYMSVTAKGLNTWDHVIFQFFFFNKSAKMSTILCFSVNMECCVYINEGKNEQMAAI